MNFVYASLDAAAWLFRPSILFLAEAAELCVVPVLLLCNAFCSMWGNVFLGFYAFFYVLIYVVVHWVSHLHSILSDIYRSSILSPSSGHHLSKSITPGETLILIALLLSLPILAAISLDSWERSSGEKVTWEKRGKKLKRRWEHQIKLDQWRLELERQEVEEKRKDIKSEQKELENDRKELELDIEEREREYVETREMNLREWWSEKQALDDEEAEAEIFRMAEREEEERRYQDREMRWREQEKREYLERINVERTMWRVEEEDWRNQVEKEYLDRRDMERARWEQLDIQEKMKWCQMRMPWVKTTAEFKKEMQGMDLETPD
jgi:hypothetical protein